MVKIENNVITATQGDTVETTVSIYIRDGQSDNYIPFVPADTDVIRFAIKSSYKDAEPIIIKNIPNNTMVLRLEAEETKLLRARRKPYVYDVEITFANGTVYTFIDCEKYYSTNEVY